MSGAVPADPEGRRIPEADHGCTGVRVIVCSMRERVFLRSLGNSLPTGAPIVIDVALKASAPAGLIAVPYEDSALKNPTRSEPYEKLSTPIICLFYDVYVKS
jgi:hypothetical protein